MGRKANGLPTDLAGLPLLLTVEETARVLRLGRSATYEALRTGEIPGVIRIGRTIRVSREGLMALLDPMGSRQDRTSK